MIDTTIKQIARDLSSLGYLANDPRGLNEIIVGEIIEATLVRVETAIMVGDIPRDVDSIIDFLNDIVTEER